MDTLLVNLKFSTKNNQDGNVTAILFQTRISVLNLFQCDPNY